MVSSIAFFLSTTVIYGGSYTGLTVSVFALEFFTGFFLDYLPGTLRGGRRSARGKIHIHPSIHTRAAADNIYID